MKERILEFLRKENKTSAQFAEEIGVQPSGISHIISGRNKPSLDFILKMLEKYSFISTDWLLFGHGSMYNEPKMADLFSGEEIEMPAASVERPVQKSGEAQLKSKTLHDDETLASDRAINHHSAVSKIVWFFEDNTFREYYPYND